MHYVCLACGNLYEAAGLCTHEGCTRLGQALSECECVDGQHKQAIAPESQKDETGEA